MNIQIYIRIFCYLCFCIGILLGKINDKDYRNHIYFSSTNLGELKLSTTARCAIKTACHFNPNAKIKLITRIDVSYDKNDIIFQECPSFEVLQMDLIKDLFKNTPLEQWYHKAKESKTKYFNADLSDAIRTALMWNYGGVYFDLDMLSLNTISNLPLNSMGKQLQSEDKKGRVPLLNGAAMIFQDHHPFIDKIINEFNYYWNPKKFGSVGPDLLWGVYKEMRESVIGRNSNNKDLRSIGDTSDNNNNNISATNPKDLPILLPKEVFYPIKFRSGPLKLYFSIPAPKKPWFPSDTIAVHLWSQLTSKMQVLPASRGGQIVNNCNSTEFLRDVVSKNNNRRKDTKKSNKKNLFHNYRDESFIR